MDYDLALKLKNAGFPQKPDLICEHMREMAKEGKTWGGFNSWKHLQTCKEIVAYTPTLEELIEACGEEFYKLIKDGTVWVAVRSDNLTFDGKTPIEAVANLWLSLNPKD